MATAMRNKIADAREKNGAKSANNILLPALADRDGSVVQELAVELVKPAKDNLRADVGDVAELAQSITAAGILEPLIVTPRGKGYLIVAGARRHAAAIKAGLKTVPALVREFSETERVEAMAIENLQREDLTPLEEARAYQRLLDAGDLTQRKLAERLGRSQSHVSKRLALLELPADVTAQLDSGGITIDDGLALVKLAKHPERLASAIKDGPRYHGGMQETVKRELAELTREGEIRAARAKLEADGTRLVDMTEDRWGQYELPRTVAELIDSKWYDGIEISVARHAAFECHAAAVHPKRGTVTYVCTKPANHAKEARGRFAKKAAAAAEPESEKEKRRVERAKEHAAQLRARTKNVELGQLLAEQLAAPKIDESNMRILAELLMFQIAGDLGLAGLRYTDEASQTVVTKKDGTISRVGHLHRQEDGRELIDKRLKAATTPEQIMGVVLQALAAARHADTNAVPQSQRYAHVPGLGTGNYLGVHGKCQAAITGLDRLAAKLGLAQQAKKR